jgi:type I restriction enzyme S subunit
VDLARQSHIVDYLDAETARIDALIEKKRRVVELLAERLRSFISRLVDDGPDISVKRVISLRTSGPRSWADLVSETGSPFIRSANLQRDSLEIKTDNLVYVDPPKSEEARRSTTVAGDVLVGITGANTGWVGCVPDDLAGGFVSQHVAILRPARVESKWLGYSLFSLRAQDQLLAGQYGGTKQQLGLDDLAELRVTNPDRPEQSRRVDVMEEAHRSTRGLVAKLGDQIARLQEHRQALITAAVTGELEIPGAAA